MKKILIIEDNDDIRNNTAEILELSSYEVIVAENGKAGVSSAIENKPDLIICDIMMPELDGYGVLHAVQKNNDLKNTPFIFLTAKSERIDFRKGMDMGADDYIVKPFSGTELLTAVNSRLKKSDNIKNDLSKEKNPTLLSQLISGTKALQKLAENRSVNLYRKKQLIYSEGNHPIYLFYVIKGKAKAFKKNEDGKELVTDLYNAGDFIGLIALLENDIYKENAEALEPMELAIIPRSEFDDLLSKNPEVARKFIQLLAKNIIEKETQLLGLAYSSLRKKVADALLLLQNKYGNKNDTNLFSIVISRESLATVAGTATESLIRTLSDFRDEKIIEMQNGQITIINEKKLKKIL